MFQRMRMVALCFVLTVCAASSARAAIIFFDNTGQAFYGLQGVMPNSWWAQGFTTPGTPINLNEATFLFTNGNPLTSLDINLYYSDGSPTASIPDGASLATVYSGTPGALSGTFTVSGLDIPLAADTSYFLAAEVTAGSLLWQYTNDSTGPNAYNLGAGWIGVNDTPLQMKLEGTAVPEPSSLALAGVASGCFWCVRRFRRRQS
jgi:hypothetical protein